MTVNRIYTHLGQKVFDAIPEEQDDWMHAIVYIERLEKYFSAHAELFIRDKSVNLNDFEAQWETAQFIHELHSITTEGGNNRWNKLEFTLFPDFKFDMQFVWDQEFQDEVDGFNKEVKS